MMVYALRHNVVDNSVFPGVCGNLVSAEEGCQCLLLLRLVWRSLYVDTVWTRTKFDT